MKQEMRLSIVFRREARKFLGGKTGDLFPPNHVLIAKIAAHFGFAILPCKQDNYAPLLSAMKEWPKSPNSWIAPERKNYPQAAPSQQAIDEFYDSWDWKRVRYDFIKDKERHCQCCGASPPRVRIVVDHILPVRHYWQLRHNSSNLQMLCDDCNMGKGSRDETDWRAA